MARVSKRLRDYLDGRSIEYETIHHDRDFTAQETAAHTHTPGWEFAKTVFVQVDGKDAMAVLPAHHRIDLEELRTELSAKSVIVSDENRIRKLCPDCDLGAAPPFGNLYDLPVYMSVALEWDDEITFNAGNHTEALRLPLADYEDLVHPKILKFSVKT